VKVCLINPPRLLTLTSVSLRATPPLGLAYIAGALREAGHEVTVLDAIAAAPESITQFEGDIVLHGLQDAEVVSMVPRDAEVIGIGCMFSNNWLANRSLINLLGHEFPDARFVIGGEHATAVPEICLEQCPRLEAVVLGEGEDTITELVGCFTLGIGFDHVEGIACRNAGNEVVRTTLRKRRKDIGQLSWPAWELFPLEDYMLHKFSYGVDRGRSLPVMATRGCPYTCTFCSSPQMWGTRYYMRTPEDMADEIQMMYDSYGIRNFDFYDLTAIIKKDWIIAFCKELMGRGLDITWQIPAGTRSEAIDDEVAGWLYRSGCRNITYAPESGSPEVLRIIKKKVILDRMLDSIRSSSKEGLNIKLNMMIGFPDETQAHVWKTTWFLVRASLAGAHDALPSIFSPYPGSELFERLRAEGRLDPRSDAYWRDIIFADDYTKGVFYSNHMSRGRLWVNILVQLLFFYGSNFLFRPVRLLRTFRNLWTKRYESRAEITLSEFMKRNTKWIVKPNPEKKSEVGAAVP
jgi:anaerobic magnesium-protoporphyrin IX monomethyl ester cyclase